MSGVGGQGGGRNGVNGAGSSAKVVLFGVFVFEGFLVALRESLCSFC